MSSDIEPGQRDVLNGITALRIMCPNGEMPKEFRAGFWRLMDEVHAEITRLRAENRALRTAKDTKEMLRRSDRALDALAIELLHESREGS